MNPLPWILIVSPVFIRDSTRERVTGRGRHEVDFEDDGMRFHNGNLPLHENGMGNPRTGMTTRSFIAKTYYSIGGSFIVDEAHFGEEATNEVTVPYPFKSARNAGYCASTGLSLSGMVMQNELALHSRKRLKVFPVTSGKPCEACIDRGMNTEGVLPGPLRVPRRALRALRRMLVSAISFPAIR